MNVELVELQDFVRWVIDGVGVVIVESDIWIWIVELGWLMVLVLEELLGFGFGIEGVVILYLEFGCGFCCVFYLFVMFVIDVICYLDFFDCEVWLECIFSGDFIIVFFFDCVVCSDGSNFNGVVVGV